MMVLEKRGIKVFVTFSSRKQLKIIEKHLRVKHPNAWSVPSFQQKKWDGFVNFFNNKENSFPHGLIKEIVTLLEEFEINYNLVGFADSDISSLEFGVKFQTDERDYQREAISKFINKEVGIIKIPTRGGKTFVSAEITRLLRLREGKINMLFITESADIYTQNKKEFEIFFNEEIGGIRGEKFKVGEITVGMIQTIQSSLKTPNSKDSELKKKEKRKRRREMKSYLDSVDFVVVDETQEFCVRIEHIIKHIKNPRWILGLSATPFKKSDEIGSKKVKGYLGDIIYEVSEKRLEKNKILAKNRVLLVAFENRNNSKLNYIQSNELFLHKNKQRNNLILDIKNVCFGLKLKTIIMVKSISHGYYLSKVLGVDFICSEHTEVERNDVKSSFLNGKGGCLIVSEIWKKGVTVTEAEIFVNVGGGKEETSILQKRGRILGAKGSKQRALSIDILDLNNPYFNQHSLSRIGAYEEQIGVEKIDSMSSGFDFKKEFECYLKIWFDG